MAAVTTWVRECRKAAMAPVRSMKCISRPPSRLPRVFASLGRMISVISDSESATRRGCRPDKGELISCFRSGAGNFNAYRGADGVRHCGLRLALFRLQWKLAGADRRGTHLFPVSAIALN